MHGGDRVAEVLKARGVDFLFTLCGGHISPILTAARQRGIRVVDVRHEATAVFAADATARLTGVPGVAAVTAGPGLTNTITAVKNAQLAQTPVVILGGAAPTVLKGRGALQDIDQRALFEPHVKRVSIVRRVRDLAPSLNEAFGVAQSGVPGPVFVECPIDLLYEESIVRSWYLSATGKSRSLTGRLLDLYLRRHLRRVFAKADDGRAARPVSPSIGAPRRSAVERASRALDGAHRPVLLVGSQAVLAPAEVDRLTDAVSRLDLPVYLSGMARGLLGKSHPLHVRHKRRLALKEADCVVLAGVPCDFRLDYGRHIHRRAVLISANRSPRDLKMNRRPDIGVEGDPAAFLRELSDVRARAADRWEGWRNQLRKRDGARESQIADLAKNPSERVNPLAFLQALDRHLADDSVVVADGGDFVATASYTVRPRRPLSWLDPGVFGTLGVGAGFALGAKLCRPSSEVWVIFGDGASGYGLTEFDTFVRHRIPVIAVVGNDAAWTQIAREQIKILKDDTATVLNRTAYDEVVEGFGASGIKVRHENEVEKALEEAKALARNGAPVLINVTLDATDFREGSISM